MRRYNREMTSSGANGPAAGQRPGQRQPLSWGGRLGAGAGTAYRKLRGRPGRNKKLLSGVQAGVSGFAKPLKGVLRVLFHQVSGLVFLFIALSLAGAFVHEYQRFQMHETGWQRMTLAGVLGCMFLYFGVTSFLRARHKR
jgi:hypothetical protein